MTGSGNHYLLTAAHCVPEAQEVFAPPFDAPVNVGPRWETNVERDVAIIKARDEAQGTTYYGGADSKYRLRVLDQAVGATPGMQVCTSGSSTGENCKLKVTEVRVRVETKDKKIYYPMVEVEAPADAIAGAKGDSGGPVYVDLGSLARVPLQVVPVGIISSGPADGKTAYFAPLKPGGELKSVEELFGVVLLPPPPFPDDF